MCNELCLSRRQRSLVQRPRYAMCQQLEHGHGNGWWWLELEPGPVEWCNQRRSRCLEQLAPVSERSLAVSMSKQLKTNAQTRCQSILLHTRTLGHKYTHVYVYRSLHTANWPWSKTCNWVGPAGQQQMVSSKRHVKGGNAGGNRVNGKWKANWLWFYYC